MANIIERFINIFVDNKAANEALDETTNKLTAVDEGTTKVTQSTDLHSKASKNNTKTLRENGGAMGYLGALTRGASNDIKDAIEAVEGLGLSFKGLRGAILATGIGALAIIILELITNWEKWKGVIDGTTASINNQKAALEASKAVFNEYTQEFDAQIAKMQAMGKTDKEILDFRLQNQEKYLAGIQANYDKEYNIYITKTKGLNKVSIELQNEINGKFEEAQKARANFLLQNELLQLKILKDSKDKQIELFKELINKRKESLQQYNQEVLNSLSGIKTLGDKYKELNQLFGKNDTYKQLFDISKDYNNFLKYATQFDENTTKLKTNYQTSLKLINSSMLSKEDKDKQIKTLNELYESQLKNINKQKAEIGLLYGSQQEGIANVQRSLDDYWVKLDNQRKKDEANNLKQVSNIEKIKDLTMEVYNLENKPLRYDNQIESRINNTAKYKEIEQRINDIYDKRKKLIEQTLGLQLSTLVQQGKEKDKEITNLDEKIKQKQNDLLSSKPEDRDKLVKDLQDLQDQRAAIVTEASNLGVAEAQSRADFELAIAMNKSDREIAIEQNTIAKKKDLKQSELEWLQSYYDKGIVIAEQSADILNGIQALVGEKNKSFAKAALAITKAAGIADVVISTQKEIRSIWSNGFLSAAPDTGIAMKTLLTAGAVARAAISTATILSQKIQDSPSASSLSTGSGPQAQFNIVGSSQTNQLAATIGAQQNKPIRTYVVGSDVETQQALDRNRRSTATFL